MMNQKINEIFHKKFVIFAAFFCKHKNIRFFGAVRKYILVVRQNRILTILS